MNFVDIIILIILTLIIGCVIYFSFIKKKDKCTGCPYAKQCNKTSCKEK